MDVALSNATGTAGDTVAQASGIVDKTNGLDVSMVNANDFRPGDIITKDEIARASIVNIKENTLHLDLKMDGLKKGDTLHIANIIPGQLTFRMQITEGLYPGSVVEFKGMDVITKSKVTGYYAVIDTVDAAGFITLRSNPGQHTFDMTQPVSLNSQEFDLKVTPPDGNSPESFLHLSLDPTHPNYVYRMVNSNQVKVIPPNQPALETSYPKSLVTASPSLSPVTKGKDDVLSNIDSLSYKAGLDALLNMDGINILCIPDAAAHNESITIQKAMIEHCLAKKDRFAILDSWRGVPSTGKGSVEEQRLNFTYPNGFAALYYPWLVVRDPAARGSGPLTKLVPPSGHIAGIYARTDNERGVHKAPANTDVRGVLGLECLLSDDQQGPLNLEGINVLRIFPGSGQITVWGARTTVDPKLSDWQYVNIRRLMLYIEESIEDGIRWAVFEPNNLQLWQKLKRSISEFLTRLWRDGALFGKSADEAFYVRIDEALNSDSTRALGRLYIEIGVRPAYPAEFIIVRIGLWQGGSNISEK